MISVTIQSEAWEIHNELRHLLGANCPDTAEEAPTPAATGGDPNVLHALNRKINSLMASIHKLEDRLDALEGGATVDTADTPAKIKPVAESGTDDEPEADESDDEPEADESDDEPEADESDDEPEADDESDPDAWVLEPDNLPSVCAVLTAYKEKPKRNRSSLRKRLIELVPNTPHQTRRTANDLVMRIVDHGYLKHGNTRAPHIITDKGLALLAKYNPKAVKKTLATADPTTLPMPGDEQTTPVFDVPPPEATVKEIKDLMARTDPKDRTAIAGKVREVFAKFTKADGDPVANVTELQPGDRQSFIAEVRNL